MDIRNFFLQKRPRPTSVESDSEDNSGNMAAGPSSSKQTNTTLNSPSPTDLSLQGEPIRQIKLSTYPKQNNNRSFQASWYEKFLWLEYSVKLDAVFCYACRQFQPNGTKGHFIYTYYGFKNWKNATDTKNGFPAHEKSKTHLKAMHMWTERKTRESMSISVSTLVNANMLEKFRYYIKSIAEIIQFLAVNELALRGSYIVEEERERGLFINLFNYTLKKDKQLAECVKHVPDNAKYTSPEIQNEIISILAEIVREEIVADVKTADVPWFTLLEDGTRDKNNRENVSIGLRYVKNGKIIESLLGVYNTNELDAATFTNMTLNILKDNDIDTTHLLSQCYDGASVMSGRKGGVAALIQKALGRTIPYVHCFNHRLHLVVVRTVTEIDIIKHFFDQAIMLHQFFSHGKVAAIYEGKSIVRLLEQRWSGHLAIVNVIFSNYSKILSTLDEIKICGSFSGQDIAKSVGIKSVMLELNFRFSLVFMKKLLGLLEPADAALQARKTSLNDANSIINSVKNQIQALRTLQDFENLVNEANQLLSGIDNQESRKRESKLSSHMRDYLVMGNLPISSTSQSTEEIRGTNNRQVYFETLDLILCLLNERFSDNDELINAISSIEEFNPEKLKYLQNLGITLPSPEELAVVKDFLNSKPNADYFTELFKQRDAFKKTYALVASVATFGCSTALNESSFSVLTAINRPQRYSMNHPRMADLIYLAFERQRTETINFDLFLKKFHNRKQRRLQIF